MTTYAIPGEGILRSETIRRRGITLRRFWKWMETKTLTVETLTRPSIQEWMAVRMADGIAVSTLRTELRIIHAWLSDLDREEIMRKLRRPKEARPIPNALHQREDWQLMLSASKHAQYPLFALCRWAALRVSEAVHLTWDAVDTGARRLDVRAEPALKWAPKTHEERRIPMAEELAVVLRRTKLAARQSGAFHDTPCIVAHQDPETQVWRPYSRPDTASRMVSDFALRVLGRKRRPKVTPHTLRRTCLTLMLSRGVPLPVVMRFAGHASITSTQRYLDPEVLATRGYEQTVATRMEDFKLDENMELRTPFKKEE